MIPNGYREERDDDGTLHGWNNGDDIERVDVELDVSNGKLCVTKEEDCGRYCNLNLDLDVIVELLCRAGFTVREPERDEP